VYTDEVIQDLRQYVKEKGVNSVTWLAVDERIEAPKPGPDGAYGRALVGRLKEKLLELEGKGELGEGGEVVLY
jgi:hypothetical protein